MEYDGLKFCIDDDMAFLQGQKDKILSQHIQQ
jgi:hypothetical protein